MEKEADIIDSLERNKPNCQHTEARNQHGVLAGAFENTNIKKMQLGAVGHPSIPGLGGRGRRV